MIVASGQAAQAPAQTPPPPPQLTVATLDRHTYAFDYSIPNPNEVKAAWIEVWDRPQLLLRQSVAVRPSGRMKWVGSSRPMPGTLFIALLDPDATREFICFDDCTQEDPTQVPFSAQVVAGPEGGYPSPELQTQAARIVAESEGQELLLSAIYLQPGSRVLVAELVPGKRGYKPLQYLPVEYVDLRHLKVWLPYNLLQTPRVLMLDVMSPAEGGGGPEPVFGSDDQTWVPMNSHHASVLVVCKDSPHLDRLEPDELRADAADNDPVIHSIGDGHGPDDNVTEKGGGVVKLHGGGFNRQSRVVLGWDPLRSQNVKSQFVSSEELRVWLDPDQLKGQVGQAVPLWVVNDKEGCGISEKKEVRVRPTERDPLPVPTGWITNISPYPVPLINQDGPEEMELGITGDNFRPNDNVIAATLRDRKYKNLKTVFISPQQLRAWLPRDMWRVHRLSFRFVIRTAAGEQAIEVGEPQ